jgi:hypothetical protein
MKWSDIAYTTLAYTRNRVMDPGIDWWEVRYGEPMRAKLEAGESEIHSKPIWDRLYINEDGQIYNEEENYIVSAEAVEEYAIALLTMVEEWKEKNHVS